MTDHPSTYKAADTHHEGVDWDDRAWIHRADESGGVFDSSKRLHSGTLAEMVALMMNYPAYERGAYVIEKAGDRRLTRGEIEALAARRDYPG